MEDNTTDLKTVSDTFGINQLLNASASGLALFKKRDDRDDYVCTADNDAARAMTGFKTLAALTWEDLVGAVGYNSSGLAQPTPQSAQADEVYFTASDTWCRIGNTSVDEAHFLCTLTDITNYKDIKERENIVLEILHDAEKTVEFGTWIWYHTNEQVEWSQGLYELLGYSPESAQQCPASYDRFMEHIHPNDLERVLLDTKDRIGATEPVETEYRIKTLSGQERSVLSRSIYHPGDAKSPPKLTGCIVDVTSIKRVRNQLLEKVEELNRSNGDLEQFAYVASHDLQEPLRKIVSFGERLEKKGKDTLDVEMGMYLDRILNATRRMQSMISNLLEFSRLTRTQQGFESTDLNSIVRSVLSDLELTIKQKNAILELAELPTAEIIPSQMAQLFQNLLSNSLKFTDDEAQPFITIAAETLNPDEQLNYGLPASRSYVRLTFSDNGIGFDDDDANRIFTIFQRLRGRSEYEGAGIGLSVCKKVVENHSGIIMASGKPGAGATFTIVLPLSQAS